jgi:hypothetical protein
MIGLLLSYTHLLGHKGLTRMFADMQPYYFNNFYAVTKQFISSCYSCFLVNKGNRKNKIGIYQAPSYPMQEINLDLAENLNNVNGYSHLLVTQCELTNFVQIFPMKSKQAEPVTNAVLASVIQPFNVQRIHSDNGPCFRSHQWLRAMAAFNVQVIASCRARTDRAFSRHHLIDAQKDVSSQNLIKLGIPAIFMRKNTQ